MELKDFAGKLCRGKSAYEFVPKEKQKFDLSQLAGKLRGAGVEIEVESPYILIVKISGTQASVFKSGKLIVKNTDEEEKAREIAERLVSKISDVD